VQISSTVPIVSLALNAEAFPVFSSLSPGDLPAGTPLGAAGPWVTITNIWSNQLGNSVIANYLPGGAGIRGSQENYILMGTDSGNAIQAGASIQIPSDIDTSHLTVRLAYIQGDTLTAVGTGSLNGNTASMTVEPFDLDQFSITGADIPSFEVVAFQDLNGNGIIDPGELVARTNPNRFQVITEARYGIALADFSTGASVGGLLFPNAATLLSAFTSGTTPPEATRSEAMVYTNMLSHSVGTTFTTGGPNASGMIPQYTFPPGSTISSAVLQSNAFGNTVTGAAAASCAAPEFSQVPLNTQIVFDAFTDPDLFLTFHTATLSAVLQESPAQATVTGSLTKLYNWDLEGAGTSLGGQLLDPMGASLQAGFPTMGTNGVIFWAVVQFNDPVNVPQCPITVSPTQGFSASGQQGSVSGSMTYSVQDSGSIPIAFATSVDVPWLTVSAATGNLQPNGTAAITVSTNAAANNLAAGSYTGTIAFSSGATTITISATLSVTNSSPTPPPPAACQVITQGPYSFRVVNLLTTDALVYFGDVTLPDGQTGSLSFGAQMNPGECDIVELPEIAIYSVDISQCDSDGNPIGTVVSNTLTFSDTSSAFIFDLVSTYTVFVAGSNCSAAPTTFAGQPAYSVCVP
jgi:hypothetical protein